MTATQTPAQDVSGALTVVNDAANDARHRGDYDRANALVRARVTLYQAARELQQTQAAGGKIANGHHCGLSERLCNHPSHAQSSALAERRSP